MTGFDVGDKIKIFCIPSDPATFGEFLKSSGQKYVKKFSGVLVSENNLIQVLSHAEKHILSGAEVCGFNIVKFPSEQPSIM
ncbi:MAG: hypothetical protein M3275_01075 [Thermoproteota archaeon]|nr:hypothetical protein [Thermoproteota archaeon]MDQ3966970.1 hypothetical protein [Thermoproteota archaeon]